MSSTTNGIVESNGTETTEANRIAGVVVQTEKPKRKPKAKKTSSSRWMTLFNTTRDNTSGKGQVKGFVPTDEGDVSVTLRSFPSDLTDEAYASAAEGNGIQVKFDLEGRKLAGVHLQSGTDKLKGEAALNFLEAVANTEGDESSEE